MFSVVFIFLVVFGEILAQNDECGSTANKCDPTAKIRYYEGVCNNIQNPKWGSVSSLYSRLIPAQYDDDVSSFRKAKNGEPLPNVRLISSIIYKDKKIKDQKLTLNAMQFGQLFAHDLGNRLVIGVSKCCSSYMYQKGVNKEKCHSIPVPPSDPVYSKFNAECLPYTRSATNFDRNCSLSYKSAQQMNEFTGYLDLHPIYGITKEQNARLRTFKNGQLRVTKLNGQDWFRNSTNPGSDCGSNPHSTYCFQSADFRINQNPHLAIQNVILLREHNRVALRLSKLNPHWNDEVTFQTARNILIGMFQHISINELIPTYINREVLYENGILVNTTGFVNDYDSNINASPFSEFSQAAFRHGHSMVAGSLMFADESRNLRHGLFLKNSYNNVSLLHMGDNFDMLLRGLTTQHSLASDVYHDSAITHHLLRGFLEPGLDLKAIDIQRSRDHGIASYNNYRELCNLTRGQYFSDFADVMDIEETELLENIYDHPDDIDLAVGGSLERPNSDGLAGPTFTCIWLKQLKNIRKGDRLFYDHEDGPFTWEQLNEIRKASVSKLYCDNSHGIKKMQPNGFLVISEKNGLVPCETLPEMDLTKWKDY